MARDHDVAATGMEGGRALRSALNPIRSRAARRQDHGQDQTAQPARPQLRADGDAAGAGARRRAADVRPAARRAPRFRRSGSTDTCASFPVTAPPFDVIRLRGVGLGQPHAQLRGGRQGGPRLSPAALGAALSGRRARSLAYSFRGCTRTRWTWIVRSGRSTSSRRMSIAIKARAKPRTRRPLSCRRRSAAQRRASSARLWQPNASLS